MNKPKLRIKGTTRKEALSHPLVMAHLEDVARRAGRTAERLGESSGFDMASETDVKVRPKGRGAAGVGVRFVDPPRGVRLPLLKNILLVAGQDAARGGGL